MIRVMVAAATVVAALTAVSVVVYLGLANGYFITFIVVTLLLFLATFALLGGMRASGLRLGVIRGIPVAAAVSGNDFKRYHLAGQSLVSLHDGDRGRRNPRGWPADLFPRWQPVA